MNGLLIDTIKVGMVSFVCGKTLKVMGKKDFADVIYACAWLSAGISIIILCSEMYSAIMNSEIVQLINRIFN